MKEKRWENKNLREIIRFYSGFMRDLRSEKRRRLPFHDYSTRFRKEKGKYLRRFGWLFNMLRGECCDLHDISCRWSVFQVHAAYNFSSATTIFAGDRWEFWYAFSLCLLQTILSFSWTTRVLVLMRITFSSVAMMFARMRVYLVVNTSSMLYTSCLFTFDVNFTDIMCEFLTLDDTLRLFERDFHIRSGFWCD